MLENVLPALQILGGIILLLASNICLGTLGAIIEGSFDFVKGKQGLLKAGSVLLAVCFAYVAGCLVPHLSIGMINGQAITLLEAITIIITATYCLYAFKVVQKLIEILQLKINLKEKEEIDNGN